LTYSLAIPAAHPLANQAPALYTAVHEAFIAVLAPQMAARNSPWRIFRWEQDCRTPACDEPFLCFQRRACGDVVLEPTEGGYDTCDRSLPANVGSVKILGSAQRRRRGAILQHGSLLLEKSPYAPELDGWREVIGTAAEVKAWIEGLSFELERALRMRSRPAESRPTWKLKASELVKDKYGTARWTKRR
jgi:lipoate-protein ligase A